MQALSNPPNSPNPFRTAHILPNLLWRSPEPPPRLSRPKSNSILWRKLKLKYLIRWPQTLLHKQVRLEQEPWTKKEPSKEIGDDLCPTQCFLFCPGYPHDNIMPRTKWTLDKVDCFNSQSIPNQYKSHSALQTFFASTHGIISQTERI